MDWRRFRRSDSGVALAVVGFLAYPLYLGIRFGDPLLFNSVQRYWNQPSGPVTLLKLHLGGIILFKFAERARYIAGCLFQGLLTVGCLALVPRLIRRFGWGYGALVAIAMGLPFIGSKDFQGTGRYILAGFPVFALIGEWLADRSPWVRRSVLTLSGIAALIWSSLYARGFYVA